MKRYYNATTKEWYNEGQSMTKRVENGIFSGIPSEEQLRQWGFVEYEDPVPTPEERLAQAKRQKVAELEAYDSSEEVNSFLVNIGNEAVMAWFTPEQRADYKNSIDAAELLGRDVVRPVIYGKEDRTAIAAISTASGVLNTEVGKYYRIDVAVDTLAVTLPAMTDLTTVRTVVIYLTAGTTPAVTITAADSKSVVLQDGYEIKSGKTYEVSCLYNGAAWVIGALTINTGE